jgi:hypothetical protein
LGASANQQVIPGNNGQSKKGNKKRRNKSRINLPRGVPNTPMTTTPVT